MSAGSERRAEGWGRGRKGVYIFQYLLYYTAGHKLQGAKHEPSSNKSIAKSKIYVNQVKCSQMVKLDAYLCQILPASAKLRLLFYTSINNHIPTQ